MKYFDNQFLFSQTYINEYIKVEDKSNRLGEQLKNVFIQAKQWNYEYIIGDYRDDPWDDYIDSIISVLGFKSKRQNQIRYLYTNTITETEDPVATCLFIDREADIDSKEKGRYYAYNSIKAGRDAKVKWAMLTNGYRWRIYNIENISPYENYLEIDIESSIRNNDEPNDAFKLFYLFFNSSTYYQEGDELKIDMIKEKSDKTAETIEDILRGKAEGILTELCYGLKEEVNKETYNESDRKNIYNDAIILLYRLLFFGYAESRGLLPITEEDANYKDSFYKLCEDAKNILNAGELHTIQNEYGFWNRLDEHLRIYVDNTYNGGLFNNFDKPVLSKYSIKNKHLINCLAELSYNKDRSGQYKDQIQYKDLSVRNLGSIYEGILEYQLFIAKERMVQRKTKGKVKYIPAAQTTLKTSDINNIIEQGGIYLSQDAVERKDTGSYYTPEDVVEYIVNNTIGRKLKELREELQDRLKESYDELSYEPTEMGKLSIKNTIDEITKAFIEERILTLSILDSAMGSGHFLVNAAYRVANEIVDIVSENDWTSGVELPADINYWKRQVVENCIYGIDINELAVALARLSLWLISASNDKALSFIDHHLKVGDSIIGIDKTKIEKIEDKTNISLFDVSYERFMESILLKYNEMKEIGSKTKEDVEKQKKKYEEIEKELELVKYKYNYYLASQYQGGIEDKIKYAEIMNTRSMDIFQNEDIRPLILYAKENKFFHWEIEFPEVFNKGGFDIAIGNPPYVDVQEGRYKRVIEPTLECRNLYAYMAEINLKNLNGGGYYGAILPSASVCTPRMNNLQEILIKDSRNIFISTYDDRPGKIFEKLESMRVAIILMSKKIAINDDGSIFVTKYNRFLTNERKKLFSNLKYTKITSDQIINGYIPKYGDTIETSIRDKVFKNEDKIGNYMAKNGNKLFYGVGVRYWIKVLNRPSMEITDDNPRLSSGEKIINIDKRIDINYITCILNSSLFFWFFQNYSDCRNFSLNAVKMFPINKYIDSDDLFEFNRLSVELMDDYFNNSIVKETTYRTTGSLKYREFKIRKSKLIIDRIDDLLGRIYGLSKKEVEFIKNYEINYRMGNSIQELNEGEE